MKSRVAILISLVVFSLAANAMPPHASLHQLVHQSDLNCEQAGSYGGLGDLIHQIGLIKQQNDDGSWSVDSQGKVIDPRGSILEIGHQVGLSDSDILRARHTTGYIFCPGSGGSGGAAALVGDGTQLITSAHIFVDDSGNYYEPLSDCFFQNQASPNKRVRLKFNRDLTSNIFSKFPTLDSENDLAIVSIDLKSLKEGEKLLPEGVKPFPIDDSGSSLKKRQKIVMISPTAPGKVPVPPPNAPVVQACHYMTSFAYAGARKVSGVYSDCTIYKGNSGSIQLVRVNGQWAIRAVASQSPKDDVDYAEFNVDATNKKPISYAFGTEITPEMAGKINNFIIANANSRSFIHEASKGH